MFADCFVLCELQKWKEWMENGQWRCFFFYIFVLLFGYGFITQTSFKLRKTCLCFKSVGPARAGHGEKKLKRVCLFCLCWGLKQASTGENGKCCKETPFSHWFYSLTAEGCVYCMKTLTIAKCVIRSFFVKLLLPGDWRFSVIAWSVMGDLCVHVLSQITANLSFSAL